MYYDKISGRKFTDRSRKVLQLANQEAQRLNHEYIGSEHILLGLVKEGGGIGCKILDIELKHFKSLIGEIRSEIEKLVQKGPDIVIMGKLPFTPRAKKVIEYAEDTARTRKADAVNTFHLLIGILRENEGVGARVLNNLGVGIVGIELYGDLKILDQEEKIDQIAVIRARKEEIDARKKIDQNTESSLRILAGSGSRKKEIELDSIRILSRIKEIVEKHERDCLSEIREILPDEL